MVSRVQVAENKKVKISEHLQTKLANFGGGSRAVLLVVCRGYFKLNFPERNFKRQEFTKIGEKFLPPPPARLKRPHPKWNHRPKNVVGALC